MFAKKVKLKKSYSMVCFPLGSPAGGSFLDSLEGCGVWMLVEIIGCVVLRELKLLLTETGCILYNELSTSSLDDEHKEDLGVDILLVSDTMLMFSTNCCVTFDVGDCDGGVGRGVTTNCI